MVVEPGTYRILVGASAEDLPLSAPLELDGAGSSARRSDRWFLAESFDSCSNLSLVPKTPLTGTAVAPTAPSYPASATYRNWAGLAAGTGGDVLLDVVSSAASRPGSGCTVRIEVPGHGGTWITVGRCTLPSGFSGELHVPLGLGAVDDAQDLRLVLRGGVVVSRIRLG